MSDSEDTDGMPLDGEAELSPAERKALRRIIRDDARASWAWKRLKVLAPAMVGTVVAVWQVWDWIVKHVRVTP